MNALVTGAGRGLGLEFSRQLLAAGHTVHATARRPERAPGLGELQEQFGDRVKPLVLDVADLDSIERCVRVLADQVEQIDLLINNAGINSSAMSPVQRNLRFGELEPEGILTMIRVNAIGPLMVTQAMVSLLGRGSKVVNISSWLGSIGAKTSGGNYGYCASKATLNMLARAMAFDLTERGIISVCASPGWVQTDMGGSRAKLTPEQSVSGLLSVVEGLTLADAGRFYQWDGSEHPW